MKVCHDHLSEEKVHHPSNKTLEVKVLILLIQYYSITHYNKLFLDHKKLSYTLQLRNRISE